MALPDKHFLKRLQSNTLLDSDVLWPQLKEIMAVEEHQPFSIIDMLDCWRRAQHWMHVHPEESWAPETQALFRLRLRGLIARDLKDEMRVLLQVWTRYGAYTPEEDDRRLICEALQKGGQTSLAAYAPRAATWLPKEIHDDWLQDSEAYAKSYPKPTGASTYVYFYGNIDILNPAQKQEANAMLSGYYEDYPQSFYYALDVAQIHPEPFVWACSQLFQALSLSSSSSGEWYTSAVASSYKLDALLDSLAWPDLHRDNADEWSLTHTKCLVACAWMHSKNACLGLNMEAWEQRTPQLWKSTVQLFPLFDSMLSQPALYEKSLRLDALSKLLFVEHQKLLHGAADEHAMQVDGSLFENCGQGQTP